MKTIKSIWEENTIEEHVFDEFGRARDVIRYFDNTNENQEWYSKEEIVNAIVKVKQWEHHDLSQDWEIELLKELKLK